MACLRAHTLGPTLEQDYTTYPRSWVYRLRQPPPPPPRLPQQEMFAALVDSVACTYSLLHSWGWNSCSFHQNCVCE